MEKNLLLVDDEENILKALSRLFEDEGYELIVANGGEEGLRMLKQHSVGVIISDQRMPGMTGVQFLTQAKEKYPGTIRIILSGYTELKTVTSAINDGAVYKFITKPWEDEQLLSCVDEAFHYYNLNQENKELLEKLVEQEKLIASLQNEIRQLAH